MVLRNNTQTSSPKKIITSIAATLLLMSIIAQPASAARSDQQQAALEAGTITTTAVAGAAAGGPIGFVVGGLVGMFLSSETRQGNRAAIELAAKKETLSIMNQTVAQMQAEADDYEHALASFEQQALDKLALEVLFDTGEASLSQLDLDRIQILAKHLRQNNSLHINLKGHADNRGDTTLNDTLAMERASGIHKLLIEYGVEEERILTTGHGTYHARITEGSDQDYAADRRVEIDISESSQPIMAVN